jgi:hypothetical protein
MTALIPFSSNFVVPEGYGASGAAMLSDGFGGFADINRITLKNGRFRMIVNGAEVMETPGPINVVIQGFSLANARSFYAGEYDPNAEATAPDCYSEDGVTPSVRSKKPQASTCAMCPNNVKGVNGRKSCKTFKRTVVTLAEDSTMTLYQLDAAALSLFGDDDVPNNRFNLKNYSAMLGKRGAPAAAVVTTVSVDSKATVSKMLFTPLALLPLDLFHQRHAALDHVALESLLKVDIAFGAGVPQVASGTPPVQKIAAPAPVAAAPAPVAAAPAPVAAAMPAMTMPTMGAPGVTVAAAPHAAAPAPVSGVMGSVQDLLKNLGA